LAVVAARIVEATRASVTRAAPDSMKAALSPTRERVVDAMNG